MRTLQDVRREFPGTDENGLSSEAAARSAKTFGANRLTPLPREPLWKKFLEKFDEPIIKILLAAALLSMFVDLFQANVTDGGRRPRRRGGRRRRRCSRCARAAGCRRLLFVSAVVHVLRRPGRAAAPPLRRGTGRHGRRHPGHRRGLSQRVQERPRIRGAQRPQGGAARQGAARRRRFTRSRLEEVRGRRSGGAGDRRRNPRRRPAGQGDRTVRRPVADDRRIGAGAQAAAAVRRDRATGRNNPAAFTAARRSWTASARCSSPRSATPPTSARSPRICRPTTERKTRRPPRRPNAASSGN